MYLASYITAVLSLCGCIQYSSQVDVSNLGMFDQEVADAPVQPGWDYERTNNIITVEKQQGRGPIVVEEKPGKLPLYTAEDFRNDSRCIDFCSNDTQVEPEEFHIDICFAVQTSCYVNPAKTYKWAVKVMTGILQKIDGLAADKNATNRAQFTILTYANKVNEWKKGWGDISASRVTAVKKLKIKPKKCDCQSKTKDALEKCQDILKENKRVNSGVDIPQVIIAFNDGNTQHTAYDDHDQHVLETSGTIRNMAEGNEIIPKVIPYPNPSRLNNPNRNGETEFNEYKNEETAVGNVQFPEKIDCPEYGITLPIGVNRLQEQLECECCVSDIVIVLDSSWSINKDDLHLMFHFAHDFIKNLGGLVHRSVGARFALFTYCGQVKRRISLNDNLEKHELLNKLKEASENTPNCGYTHTHVAIKAAHKELKDFGRSGVKKYIVTATDGRTYLRGAHGPLTPPNVTINAAKDAKKDGIGMLIAGLPNHKDLNNGYENEWKHIGSEPVTCSVVNMQKQGNHQPTFKDLDKARVYMSHKVCCLDFSPRCVGDLHPMIQEFCDECLHAFCPAP